MLTILSKLLKGKDDFEKRLVDVPDCIISEHDSKRLYVLTVADLHGTLTEDTVRAVFEKDRHPDLVFLLGDNYPNDIEAVLKVVSDRFKIFGVAGNHDSPDILSTYAGRIFDLNSYVYNAADYSIGGLSGSIRYKSGKDYAMLTNEESNAAMDAMPPVDILITHDKPCFSVPKTITAHSGLTGIGTYITEKKPKIVLHGHLHNKTIKKIDSTIIRCCYGVEAFEISI